LHELQFVELPKHVKQLTSHFMHDPPTFVNPIAQLLQ